jgi:transcriptional regulator with XRE-family HTH domain
MKTLGQRLRELRQAQDLSLREFAKRLGRSAAFLSDVELGRRFPSPEVLAKMARILGVPVAELQAYDTRPPIEDLKRLSELNPAYGIAFRKLIDEGVSPEEIMKLANEKSDQKKKP